MQKFVEGGIFDRDFPVIQTHHFVRKNNPLFCFFQVVVGSDGSCVLGRFPVYGSELELSDAVGKPFVNGGGGLTGSHIYVPDYFTIVFTQDKPEAILNGSFLSENSDTRFSAMFTDDIFIYSETGDFSAFTSAGKVGENYLFNSVLDFGSGRKARIFSSLIRLYVVDLINRNNLDTDIRCVSVDGDFIRISNITVPEDKLGIIFNFYRSEITGK